MKEKLNAPTLTPELIRNSKNLKCECGGMLFTEKIMFKKISAIISPTAKEETIHIPLFVCDKCGKVPSIFDPTGIVPEELKAKKIL